MCLRHPPKIVACVCIHLACKWSNYKIPLSRLKKEWFMHVLEPNWNRDSLSTLELLDELTNEFLNIFEQCPSRLKKKIMASHQAVSLVFFMTMSHDVLMRTAACSAGCLVNDMNPGNYSVAEPQYLQHIRVCPEMFR